MSTRKTPPVRIVNPVGSKSYTSHRKALEYVRQDRARWSHNSTAIEFVATDHRHRSAARAASHGSIATDKQMRGVPIIHPEKMLAPTAPNRWWSGASVSHAVDRDREDRGRQKSFASRVGVADSYTEESPR